MTWNDPGSLLPADGQTVWFRRLSTSAPDPGTYTAATQTFTATNGFTCPAYLVSRWRPRP